MIWVREDYLIDPKQVLALAGAVDRADLQPGRWARWRGAWARVRYFATPVPGLKLEQCGPWWLRRWMPAWLCRRWASTHLARVRWDPAAAAAARRDLDVLRGCR